MSEEKNIWEDNSEQEVAGTKVGSENILQQESIKQIKTSDIQNMEVHHHSQVEKKNFKEYFLEFLMIFLAVTLGFFAENLREYFSDRQKENQFMHCLQKI